MKALRIPTGRRPLRLLRAWLARYRGPELEPLGILFGLKAVARFMGVSKQQARALSRRGAIPTFELDGVTCARRSAIRQHVEALERKEKLQMMNEGGSVDG